MTTSRSIDPTVTARTADPQSATTVACWAVIAAAIFQIAGSAAPAFGFGEQIGARSDDVRTLLTPASWAFAIWGPLFFGSVIFAVWQALPSRAADPFVARLRWPAVGAFLGNGLWVLYSANLGLSLGSALIIVASLASVMTAYRVVAMWQPRITRAHRWFAILPLSALAAWLTAATIVNITATLKFYQVDAGASGPLIASAVLVVGGIIAGLALARGRGNPPYAMVFLYALYAIYAAGGQAAYPVAIGAIVAALLVFAGTFAGLRRSDSGRWFG